MISTRSTTGRHKVDQWSCSTVLATSQHNILTTGQNITDLVFVYSTHVGLHLWWFKVFVMMFVNCDVRWIPDTCCMVRMYVLAWVTAVCNVQCAMCNADSMYVCVCVCVWSIELVCRWGAGQDIYIYIYTHTHTHTHTQTHYIYMHYVLNIF